MDRTRFSLVAHQGLVLWNPLPEAAACALVDGIGLGPAARVLDVGCGRAALLLRLLERTGAHGTGIDRSPEAIALACADALGRIDPARLDFRAEHFDGARFGDATFDAALCVGATHAAGGLAATLATFRRVLVPGGAALVGEGHWLRAPDPDYLGFLGAAPDELSDLAGTVAAAEAAGFAVVRSLVTDRAAFDLYEERYAANVERFVAEHPEDPEADAFLAQIRSWRKAYVRWGRDTLGFALLVLQRTG